MENQIARDSDRRKDGVGLMSSAGRGAKGRGRLPYRQSAENKIVTSFKKGRDRAQGIERAGGTTRGTRGDDLSSEGEKIPPSEGPLCRYARTRKRERGGAVRCDDGTAEGELGFPR